MGSRLLFFKLVIDNLAQDRKKGDGERKNEKKSRQHPMSLKNLQDLLFPESRL